MGSPGEWAFGQFWGSPGLLVRGVEFHTMIHKRDCCGLLSLDEENIYWRIGCEMAKVLGSEDCMAASGVER